MRTYYLVAALIGVVITAWSFATPGTQVVASLIGGVLVGHGVMGLYLRARGES